MYFNNPGSDKLINYDSYYCQTLKKTGLRKMCEVNTKLYKAHFHRWGVHWHLWVTEPPMR